MKKKFAVLPLLFLLLLLTGCRGISWKNPKMLELDHRVYSRADYAAAYQYGRFLALQEPGQLSEEELLADEKLRGDYLRILEEAALDQLRIRTVVERECEKEKLRPALSQKELLAQYREKAGEEAAYRDALRRIGLAEDDFGSVLLLSEKTRALCDFFVENGRAADEEDFSAQLRQQMDELSVEFFIDPSAVDPEQVSLYLRTDG